MWISSCPLHEHLLRKQRLEAESLEVKRLEADLNIDNSPMFLSIQFVSFFYASSLLSI